MPRDYQETLAIRPEGPEPHQRFMEAGRISQLAVARQEAVSEAHAIREGYMETLREGDFAHVPLATDVLSGTTRYLNAKEQFGPFSPISQQLYAGLLQDAERSLMEAARKNSKEYFPKIPMSQYEGDGSYLSNGTKLSEMTARGLSPLAEKHEERPRAVNDHAIERTIEAIGRHGTTALFGGKVSLHQIMECPDYAIADHQKNPKGSNGGYGAPIKKLMLRTVQLETLPEEPQQTIRSDEQLGVDGRILTHELLVSYLRYRGIIGPNDLPSKTDIQGMLVIDTKAGSVLDLIADIDQFASTITGSEVYFGERTDPESPKQYREIEEQSAQRQRTLGKDAAAIVEFCIRLEQEGVDHFSAEDKLKAFIDNVLLDKAEANPDLAESIFDHQTAEGFRQALYLEEHGRQDEAEVLRQITRSQAPEVSYCGPGSCDLVAVLEGSDLDGRATNAGLEGVKVKYTEGLCQYCKKKGKIIYDYKNHKYCDACGRSGDSRSSAKKIGSVVVTLAA